MSISTKLDLSNDYIKNGDNMKKYLVSILFGLLIGFFLSKTILEQYGTSGIKRVSLEGENAYFIKYGEYDSLDELEKKTISLTNYIYTESDNKYIVYIGITLEEKNLNKLIEYFNEQKYEVTVEEFLITNKNFLDYLKNADKLLGNTNDKTVLGEVSSQILSKYEELVINGNKN